MSARPAIERPKAVDLDYGPEVGMCHVTVRMPVALREAVKARARRDMRPLAQAIRVALRDYAAPPSDEGEGE